MRTEVIAAMAKDIYIELIKKVDNIGVLRRQIDYADSQEIIQDGTYIGIALRAAELIYDAVDEHIPMERSHVKSKN